ncbi:hypothetical protein BSKO_07470 [Bryopsis sp. KO-2023]|nr:hypothetical protein BSKO_07470 [Bryopsis sp. KO-2023]
MDESVARRLGVLSSHLKPAEKEHREIIEHRNTSASDIVIPPGHYGVPLPEKLTPGGQWNVVRSALSPHKLVTTYRAPDDNILTLHDNLETSISRYPAEPYLGSRERFPDGGYGEYKWSTYSEVGERRTAIGSGLVRLGLNPHSTVGLYSINCPEWVLLDAAAHAYSMISVPLYDTLGSDAVQYICSHAEVEAVGCSAAVLRTMLQCLQDCPTIRLLIVWGLDESQLPVPPSGSSCRILSLRQVEMFGQEHTVSHIPPQPSDLATICYTSGTTGVPKGAMLTHANLISNSAGNCWLLDTINMKDFGPGHRHISYLPLAHIYERVNLVTCTHEGVAVGFYHGDVQELLDDIMELRPTIFCSVPRLWNRIYDKVMSQMRQSNPIVRRLFETAFAAKKAAMEKGDISRARLGALWDRLIFSKLKAKLGGSVTFMTTGASPMSAEVFDFLKICFGAVVMEGYGMTETACTITTTRDGDTLSGHVGSPIPCCEVKLDDIPEMGYKTEDRPYPRGEICVRGPSVFKGYYKGEAQTREVMDEDGWLHTGDVGMWLPQGRLKIIDRKKNIFKLAQGEYVAPEKIENVYVRSPLVLQAFVYGDSLQAQLVAIVVPDPDELIPWAKDRGIKKELPQLCRDVKVVEGVLASMRAEGRVAKLRGFEQVEAIHLVPEQFSVENGLLTPTFKLKRPEAKTAFMEVIEGLYARINDKR